MAYLKLMPVANQDATKIGGKKKKNEGGGKRKIKKSQLAEARCPS